MPVFEEILTRLNRQRLSDVEFCNNPAFIKTIRLLEILSTEESWKSLTDSEKLSYRKKLFLKADKNQAEYSYMEAIIDTYEILDKKIAKINHELTEIITPEQQIRLETMHAILLMEKELINEEKNIARLRHVDYYWFNEILSAFENDNDFSDIKYKFHKMYSLWPNRPWKEVETD